MAKKVIVGQPEKPNASTVVARDPAVELPDAHIQRVADITLMTPAEVTALLSPALANHETRIVSLEDNEHVLIESPTGNEVPLGLFPPGTLLGQSLNGIMEGQLVSGFTPKATPTAADKLLISDAAAANIHKSVTIQSVAALSGAKSPAEAEVLSRLAPLHWWNANHVVQSGGLVDQVTDIGSNPKHFTQSGAARAPLATDGNGQVYLALDGTADYYQAGVAADWLYANDGTAHTFAIIGVKPSAATGYEAIVGTVAGDTTKRGFDFYWGYVSAGDQGPLYQVCCGTLNQYVVYVETTHLGSQVMFACIVRAYGATPPARTSNGCTNTPIGAQMSVGGAPRASCIRNAAYSAVNPNFALTLGRRADLAAGQFSNLRIYDVVMDNRPWTDAECMLFQQYARTRQGLAPQFGWPASLF